MICEWCSSRFPQNSFSLISFIIAFYSLFHPPFHPISTPSPSSPLIPAIHSYYHPCLLCIHSHPFPSHSSSHTLLSHSLLSIPISILSFHSISSFQFISIFLSWLFVLSRSMVLYNFIIHRYHSLHPILFSFLFSIYLFSSLLIFFSLLWDQYHVCSDSRYRIIICCVDRKHSQSIRRNRLCSLCMIREQRHRMMRKWENEYLRIGGNRCSRSSNHRSWFHRMIIEGYLHQSNAKSILSRITEPILWKLYKSPLNSVNEERSVHSSTHSISLRIVNVLL